MSERRTIPLSTPNLAGRELDYLTAAIRDNWVSYAGPQVGQFEKSLAAEVGALGAALMASGTAALHIALLLAGVCQDDEVIMPALSFVAPANAIRYCGAFPVFVDVSQDDYQLDSDQVRAFLDESCDREADGTIRNRATNRRVSALMPVHVLGGMADIDVLGAIAEEYGLWLIEDAAEAMGALYKGRGLGIPLATLPVDRRIVCTSFNGNKLITTGGGGALFANDEELLARARHLSTTAKTDLLEFDHDCVGFNYRMTALAAAVGLAQLEQLPCFVTRKQEIANAYEVGLADVPGVLPHPRQPNVSGTFWLYTVRLTGGSRGLMHSLIDHGIMVRPLWKPLHTLMPYVGCATRGGLQHTRMLWDEALSLPCSTHLSDTDQGRVIDEIRSLRH